MDICVVRESSIPLCLSRHFDDSQDRLTDAFQVLNHIIIGNPKDVIAELSESAFSLSIGQSTITMALTIQFDNQPVFMAEKVGDLFVDRNLSTKFQSLQTAITQHTPQKSFWIRSVCTKLPGSVTQKIRMI